MQIFGFPVNSQNLHCAHQNKMRFCGTLYEDDILEGSIFDLRNKQQRYLTNNACIDEFCNYYTSQKTFGTPVTDPDMKLWNIKSFTDLGNNVYKGGMHEAVNYVGDFQKKGFKKFVILCPEIEKEIIDKCKKFGLEWESFFVPIAPTLPEALKNDLMERISMNSFVNTILDLRKGKIFIGCENGTLRSIRMITAIHNLDPQSKLKVPKNLNSSHNYGHYQFTKWLYERLNDAHKAKLGYTSDFIKYLNTIFLCYN